MQKAIAGPENVTLVARPHGIDSFDVKEFALVPGNYDATYIQLFDLPERRPDGIVWSIISDYIHMERVLEAFLERAKPTFLIAFQYPNRTLDDQCAKHGCNVFRLPWFNVANEPAIGPDHEWKADAICTGTMGGTYPNRTELFQYLARMHEDQMTATGTSSIILSGSMTGCKGFRLSDAEYHDAMRTSKYSFSGGIYDYQIPPKYFEICNFGACLVSHDMPLMKDAGFVDGETFVKIDRVEQIPDIIASDAYKTIALAGQKLVHERHSLKARAAQIRNIIENGGHEYDPARVQYV